MVAFGYTLAGRDGALPVLLERARGGGRRHRAGGPDDLCDLPDHALPSRTIIRRLLAGGYVTYVGEHYRVDSAKLWDRPDSGVPLGVAVSGRQSAGLFAPMADAMIAVQPERWLGTGFDNVAGARLPKIGQQPISWGTDAGEAIQRAHDQFRWFAGGWKVNAELPGPSAFAAVTSMVRPDDVAAALPCGPDVTAHVEAVRPFVAAGFSHIALAQIGGETQPDFLDFAAAELLPALRSEYGKPDDGTIRISSAKRGGRVGG